MSTPLASHPLLEYDAKHRVLICRECHYAIQKSALNSHLLRHKVYRIERATLLASIAQLDLLEPDQVPLPAPTSPPINTLSIISGYRCGVAGCENLCASEKRMHRHWSENHGNVPHMSSAAVVHPVTLQTFFRGTKLRYFEVTPVNDGSRFLRNQISERDETGSDLQHVGVENPPPPPPSLYAPAGCMPTLAGTIIKPSLVDFDLQTLAYLHHFIASTSSTLPCPDTLSTTAHWQTNVVLQALQDHSLMCGLLAISACHMSACVDEPQTKNIHLACSLQFFSEFHAAWDKTTPSDPNTSDFGDPEEINKPSRQLLSQLRCAYWSLAESSLRHKIFSEFLTPFELCSFIASIRAFFVPCFTFHPDETRVDDDFGREMFAQAKQILETRSSFVFEKSGSEFSNQDAILRPILDLLGDLPSRMADAFSKPQSGSDFVASMSAIAALIKCCSIIYTSDDVGLAWHGMGTWLMKIPGHFNTMLECEHPAAMVILAHWAAFLVRRTENCGLWFLKTLAYKTLVQAAERVPPGEVAIHSMLDSLISDFGLEHISHVI